MKTILFFAAFLISYTADSQQIQNVEYFLENKNILITYDLVNCTIQTDYLGDKIAAGGKMKEVGTTNWNSPNVDATNASLFTGLPGGYRNTNGNYGIIGNFGYWWSSAENNTGSAWFRYLGNDVGNAYRLDYVKRNGFSVRCLRD